MLLFLRFWFLVAFAAPNFSSQRVQPPGEAPASPRFPEIPSIDPAHGPSSIRPTRPAGTAHARKPRQEGNLILSPRHPTGVRCHVSNPTPQVRGISDPTIPVLGFLLTIPVPAFGRCQSLPLQGANPGGCRAGGMSDIAASPWHRLTLGWTSHHHNPVIGFSEMLLRENCGLGPSNEDAGACLCTAGRTAPSSSERTPRDSPGEVDSGEKGAEIVRAPGLTIGDLFLQPCHTNR